ncbi:MAG: tol-pal system protein YbgF [Gammaproteobacteria bacterium]|nr:tol-pal system protein YbgF [Gammaproteobacteria bacterium]
MKRCGLLSIGLLLNVALSAVTADAVAAEPALPPIKESQPSRDSDGVSASARAALEARITQLEQAQGSQALTEMFTRVEELQAEVQRLRGQDEELTHQLEVLKKQQRDMYLDIDRRLQQAPAARPDATDGQDSGSEQDAYQSAFSLIKDGKYEEAVRGFKAFLASYPKGSYASNAHYWLGEANYVLKRYPAALEEFGIVAKRYADSPKVADALLKMGYTHYELEQWEQARAVLADLVKRFPKSDSAPLAQNRLNRMDLEGH